MDPRHHHIEELTPNETPLMMTPHSGLSNHTKQEIEASNEMTLANVVATMDRGTKTEAIENTPRYRTKLHKKMGISFIAAAKRKDRNMKSIQNRETRRPTETIDLT